MFEVNEETLIQESLPSAVQLMDNFLHSARGFKAILLPAFSHTV